MSKEAVCIEIEVRNTSTNVGGYIFAVYPDGSEALVDTYERLARIALGEMSEE